jgi:hypothetical protein
VSEKEEHKCTHLLCERLSYFDDSLEGKMAVDPLKNKMMLDKSTHFRSKSFFWCSRSKSVDR